jgi:hypothetical protein
LNTQKTGHWPVFLRLMAAWLLRAVLYAKGRTVAGDTRRHRGAVLRCVAAIADEARACTLVRRQRKTA